MGKELCELDKKEIEKQLQDIMEQVKSPKFICRKCARAARDEDFLCKPVRIER